MEIQLRRIRIYETNNGKRPFEEWVKDLRAPLTVRRIQARLAGVSAGNLSDELIILRCGGDKSSQDKDIKKAKEFWSD